MAYVKPAANTTVTSVSTTSLDNRVAQRERPHASSFINTRQKQKVHAAQQPLYQQICCSGASYIRNCVTPRWRDHNSKRSAPGHEKDERDDANTKAGWQQKAAQQHQSSINWWQELHSRPHCSNIRGMNTKENEKRNEEMTHPTALFLEAACSRGGHPPESNRCSKLQAVVMGCEDPID